MKIKAYIITLLLFGWYLNSIAQVQINATLTKGCDSLNTIFSIISAPAYTNGKWYFGDGDSLLFTSPAGTFNKKYKKPGIYSVTLDLDGTPYLKSNYIVVGKTPNMRIAYKDTVGAYTVLVTGDDNSITPTPIPYSYQWTVDPGFTENQRSFVHQFDSVGSYSARLITHDSIGCADTVVRMIDIVDALNVPNVFTPNNDGFNDEFEIKYNGKYRISLSVFTRAGTLIYKNEAKRISWDGHLPSGDLISPGIYFYIVETLDAHPARAKKGFVYVFE